MDPVTMGRYQYPERRGSYMDSAGQVVNPLIGETRQPSDPLWQFPLP
jgi:hypothetical protein